MSITQILNSTVGSLEPETAADIAGGVERIMADARAGVSEAQALLREGDADRAVDYLVDRSNNVDEVIHAALRNTDDAAQLNRELSAIALRAGRLAAARAALIRVLRYTPDDFIAMLRLGQVDQLEGKYAEALSLYKYVRDNAEKEHNRAAFASAVNNIGTISYELGLPDAEDRLKEALALAIELNDAIMLAGVRGNLGALYGRQGRRDEAKTELTQARDLYREHNDALGEATQESNLAAFEHMGENYVAAEKHIMSALRLYVHIPHPERVAFCEVRLSLALLRQKRFVEADTAANSAMTFYRSKGIARGVSDAAQALGNIAAEQHEWDAAVHHYELSHAMAVNTNEIDRIAGAEGNLGLAKLHAGELDVAFEHLKRAQQLYGEMNRPQGVAFQVLHLGDVEMKRGDTKSARLFWKEALEISEGLGMTSVANEARSRLEDRGPPIPP